MTKKTIATEAFKIITYLQSINEVYNFEIFTSSDLEDMDDFIKELEVFEDSQTSEIIIFQETNKLLDRLSEIYNSFMTIQEYLKIAQKYLGNRDSRLVIPKNIDRKDTPLSFMTHFSLQEFYLNTIEKLEMENENINIFSKEEIIEWKERINLLKCEDSFDNNLLKIIENYFKFSCSIVENYDYLHEQVLKVHSYYFTYHYIDKLNPQKYLISKRVSENKCKVLYSEKIEQDNPELNGWVICSDKSEMNEMNNNKYFDALMSSQLCEIHDRNGFYNNRIMGYLLDIYEMPIGTKIEWKYHPDGWLQQMIDLSTQNDISFPPSKSIEEINRIVESP